MVDVAAIDDVRDEDAPDELEGQVPLGGVLARMQVHEPSFTPKERLIAASLRANGRELVGLSIDELAARVGVSRASVIRFCNRLGYRGLREMNLALAAEVLGDTSAAPLPIAPGDDLKAIVRKVTAAAQQALAASADVLDEGALARSIDALTKAGRVQLFGVGGSAAMALDAHYRFARLGLPVAVLTDAQLQPVVAALLKPDDVAFVISHTGRSVEPVHVLQEAKRVGATTILLTSFANTPAARWADIVLLTAPVATAPGNGMAPLRVAQLTVIDMLCVAIAAREDADRQDFRVRYDTMLARHMLPSNGGAAADPGFSRARSSFTELDSSSWTAPSATVAESNPPRRGVTIDGVVNARTLGGFRLPSGKLTAASVIRSGMLTHITPAGIEQLKKLGVTTVVDMRSDEDLLYYSTPDLGETGIEIVRAPMSLYPGVYSPDLDNRAEWIALYRAWVDGGQAALRKVAETIGGTEGTVLMHCMLGEDRTGIASALLLDLIGVDEAEIVEDYRTSPNGPGWEFLVSAVLAHVRERWGSTAAYFVDSGIHKAVLSRARARLEGRLVI
jgi:DNA-binding MurR/RpiR family transcriptional regulator